MHRANRQHAICRCQQGFSLFELLIVLVLLGIMAGVATPPVGRFLDQLAFRRDTDELLAQLRGARLRAISSGRVVSISIGDGNLQLSAGSTESQPMMLAETLAVEFDPQQITFYPEGFATPAAVRIQREGRSAQFTIDPLTGLPVKVSSS